MTWRTSSAMSERLRFVERAQAGAKIAPLCREFGISRQTGYKWLGRFSEFGALGLVDRERTPHRQPSRVPHVIEAAVLQIRKDRRWGARKIRAVLRRQGIAAPAVSTIQQVLERNGCVESPIRHTPVGRFERSRPNELWQMDFKGNFPLDNGERCHPLTILDDHSRFNLALRACPNEQLGTVRQELTRVFETYGLPDAMLTDNGSPWGDSQRRVTRFGIWLMRLGITLLHGRPWHPQTQGKEERFHRTLEDELLRHEQHPAVEAWQPRFDDYREIYNWERPHEALAMEVPGSRYQESKISLPSRTPEFVYPLGTVTRKVQRLGCIYFRGQIHRCVQTVFCGQRVALLPTELPAELGVFFGKHRIGTIDLKYLGT
jgi:putative transposase